MSSLNTLHQPDSFKVICKKFILTKLSDSLPHDCGDHLVFAQRFLHTLCTTYEEEMKKMGDRFVMNKDNPHSTRFENKTLSHYFQDISNRGQDCTKCKKIILTLLGHVCHEWLGGSVCEFEWHEESHQFSFVNTRFIHTKNTHGAIAHTLSGETPSLHYPVSEHTTGNIPLPQPTSSKRIKA